MKRRSKVSGEQCKSSPLIREEWDFRRVPDDEIVTCFYYEYARSRDDVCQLVRSWREKLADLDKAYDAENTFDARMQHGGRWDETFANEETAQRRYWSELAQLTDWNCSQLLINLADFPDKPWPAIQPRVRAKWKHLLWFYGELDAMRGGLRVVPFKQVISALRMGDVSTRAGTIVPFLIDWHGGVEKVIGAFEKWARQRYSQLKPTPKKKSRDTYRESLKQLGVMRLKDSLKNWAAVQDYARDAAHGYQLYGQDHTLWRKARLAAIKRKKEMFPITRTH